MKRMSFNTMFLSICFLSVLLIITNRFPTSMAQFTINSEWNGAPINHLPAQIQLNWNKTNTFLTAVFTAPFFNDPTAPDGPAGKPFPKLWDYEVVEIFFLCSTTKQYLEVEVSPHGQHLLLLLNGTRNAIKDELPLSYISKIVNKEWTGTAKIPLSYLPHNVDQINAYAIHGSGDNRVYESLYPAEKEKFTQPDFHRLQYFRNFAINEIVTDTSLIGTYWDNL